MKAVILAAGEGTRMRPLTRRCPKVMLPIGNKPLLQHVIERVKDAGVDHFILVIGYQGDTIIEHFGEGERFGVKIDYVIQQERLGTAHAIGTARSLIDERFLVLNGDVMVTTAQVRTLLERDEVAVMAALEVDDPSQFGVLEVDGGLVVKLHEKPDKPPTNLANAGIYVFEPEVFGGIDKTPLSIRDEYEITRTIQDMIDSGVCPI